MSNRTRSTVSTSVRPVPGALGTEPGLRAWARRSPWLVIAVLLHVLVITLLSVVFLRVPRGEPQAIATAVLRAPAQPELPPPAEDPPLLVRDLVPLPPAAETELVQPLEVPLTDGAAGRAGELVPELEPDREPG